MAESRLAVVQAGVVKEPKLHICIAMPTHDIVPSKFTYDLTNMAGFTGVQIGAAQKEQGDMVISLLMVEGTYVHTMRQTLVDAAIQAGATHMLWLDTDMQFPKDVLFKLLRRNKPIVGINYANRRIPIDFVAIKSREGNERLWTTAESTGLEEVEGMGFGIVLMQMNVLDNLGPPPWFQNIWCEETNDWMGEDVFFCQLLQKAGVKLYVDHDLSKECAHVGQFSYKPEHAEAWQTENETLEEDGDGNQQLHGATGEDSRHAE